jgi:para-aminobenzoate synthetase component 1
VIAHLSFDLRLFTERLPDRHPPTPRAPLLVARLFGTAVLLDRDRRERTVVVVRDSGDPAFDRRAADAADRLLARRGSGSPACALAFADRPAVSHGARGVPPCVRRRGPARAGDVYQVNLTHPVEGAVPGGATALFERLVANNPSPFGGLFRLDADAWIVSGSPERFLETRDREVRTRPIKGTAPRHPDPEADRHAAEALLASEKDRAELAMVVDLLRNDLARGCEAGSVVVEEACALETHPTVRHLVATIRGTLREGGDVPDLLARAWPGGSISGVPKIRALAVIDGLESARRGPYTGSLGYLSLHGRSDWNLLIRSAHVVGETATAWVGGGITVMSDADAEWRETLHKLRGLAAAAPWSLPEAGS